MQKRATVFIIFNDFVFSLWIEKNLSTIESEDEKFRHKIEKLREHAGESWLTVYNEMGDEKQEKVSI